MKVTKLRVEEQIFIDMDVMIGEIRYSQHIRCDIKTSHKDYMKDYLAKKEYDVSSGLIIVVLLPKEAD